MNWPLKASPLVYATNALLALPVVTWANEGCPSHSTDGEIRVARQQVRELEARWESLPPRTYTYTVIHGGGPFGYFTTRVKVRGTSCTARQKFRFVRRHPWKTVDCEGVTISHLLHSVDEALGLAPSSFSMTVDPPSWSIIRSFSVDPECETEDEDWYFRIRRFRSKVVRDGSAAGVVR
ncbi:MAG: hypothetical protein AAF602_11525 [Myxococcota bacterium]